MRLFLFVVLLIFTSCGSTIKKFSPMRDAMINAGGNEEEWVNIGDKEAARKVIRKNLIQIRECYQQELKNDSSAEGKIIVNLDIEVTGSVRVATAAGNTFSKLAHDSMEVCVLEKTKRWTFNSSLNGKVMNIVYPFEFFRRK